MGLIAALLIVGVLLLLAETILPGLIAGIAGMACLIAAVVLAYMDFGGQTGTAVLFGVIGGLIIGTFFWIKYFPDSRLARPFISHRTIGGIGAEKPELLNKTGMAFTNLRPCGTALIDGKRVDVVTEGAMVEKGTPVKVVQIEGMRIVVRAV